ncbi:MAG: hypothetical protein U0528_07000 [Anaerolineae bacterium]|nr:hypothetical protein [Anaerolineae bacterium]
MLLPLLHTLSPLAVARRAAINWLLRDEFTTNDAAPVATPRTCEPGPGTLIFTQTDGQFGISGTALSFPTQSTSAWGDQGFLSNETYSRIAGRALLTSLNFSTFSFSAVGFFDDLSSTVNGDQFQFTASVVRVNDQGEVQVIGSALSTSTDYKLAIVLRSNGAAHFIKGGAFSDWTLLWIGSNRSSANEKIRFTNFSAVGTFDHLRLRDLPAPFDSDEGIATLNVASPSSGSSYSGDASGVIDLTVTSPASLTGTKAELRYRVQDANNYWVAYFDSAGAFKLDSVSGGVATNRISVASVISTSQTRTIRVICDGSNHDCYTLSGSTWTKRGSTVNVSHLNTQTAISPVLTGAYSMSNLRSYPRTAAAYAELDNS